ncbi:GNAT family N-acetyltransferase [Streptomyces sp. NPDC059002]|uniref:GNAT family N-acetyltransferase n=1 Tax=Streptomyces sp. NPDC059002 TaxID=3346690 RepID=UPI003697B02C
MNRSQTPDVRLEPWSEDGGLDLLHALNTPELTEYLGGPETREKVEDRHRRYLATNDHDRGQMFRIVLDGELAGSIGHWETTWQGEQVWETGWGVLPAFQGRGLAATAARLLVPHVRAAGRHPHLHAFPATGHAASNAVCRKAGFTLVGEASIEYPKGNWHPCNDWRLALNPA